jgi:glycerol-3-phosphate acyltransferase PlsY
VYAGLLNSITTANFMIINDTFTGIIAILIAYLIGSISSAYVITRIVTGKDIRTLGGGNAGANNVYQEVGLIPAIGVGVFDLLKGGAAMFIARLLVDDLSTSLVNAPLEVQSYIMAAGLAVVAGHIWPVYLKFRGGNGLATTIGVLAVIMTTELLIAIAIILILVIVTRNPILSVNISLVSVPISTWLLEKPWIFILFAFAIIVMMVINFIPTAKEALVKAGGADKLFADLFRRNRPEKKEVKKGKKEKAKKKNK